MAIVKDWIEEVARDLVEGGADIESLGEFTVSLSAAIAKHSPFKADVAYMPVPRCDGCRHWASDSGACTFIRIDAPKMPRGSLLLLTTADFGCVRWKTK